MMRPGSNNRVGIHSRRGIYGEGAWKLPLSLPQFCSITSVTQLKPQPGIFTREPLKINQQEQEQDRKWRKYKEWKQQQKCLQCLTVNLNKWRCNKHWERCRIPQMPNFTFH